MYTVYILKDNNGKIYKGVTNDLKRRLKEHRAHRTITTSKMGSLEVAYTEEFESFIKARKREVYLKSAAGRRFLKKILSK
jgi:putative endonuclease